MIVDCLLKLACEQVDFDLYGAQMNTCRKENMVNQAYNKNKSLRNGSKDDVRGWQRTDTYDWEIKLAIASNPLKQYMD